MFAEIASRQIRLQISWYVQNAGMRSSAIHHLQNRLKQENLDHGSGVAVKDATA